MQAHCEGRGKGKNSLPASLTIVNDAPQKRRCDAERVVKNQSINVHPEDMDVNIVKQGDEELEQ